MKRKTRPESTRECIEVVGAQRRDSRLWARGVRQKQPEKLRRRYYALATEKGYVQTVQQFVRFAGPHPSQWSEVTAARFLDHVAMVDGVSAGTQENKVSALGFFFSKALRREVDSSDYLHAKERCRWCHRTAKPRVPFFPQIGIQLSCQDDFR